MTDMTTAAHAKRRPEGLIAAWLCLIIAGTTTVTFNVWNAFHSGMVWPVAVLVGISPVALAMVVSHLVATCRAGNFLKTVTFAVMVGAMVLSVRATGVVVAPAEGKLWWLFGAVIDTAALVALQLLLSIKTRAAQAAAQRAEAEVHAADERTALQAELDALRAAQDAALETLARDLETAQLAASESGRREAEAAAKAELLAQKLARISGRKSPRKSTPKKASASNPETTVPEDVDTQAAALEILASEPTISGSELGRRLGRTERYGCMLKKQLAGSVAGPEEN